MSSAAKNLAGARAIDPDQLLTPVGITDQLTRGMPVQAQVGANRSSSRAILWGRVAAQVIPR